VPGVKAQPVGAQDPDVAALLSPNVEHGRRNFPVGGVRAVGSDADDREEGVVAFFKRTVTAGVERAVGEAGQPSQAIGSDRGAAEETALRGKALNPLVLMVEDGEGSVGESVKSEGKDEFAGALPEVTDGTERMSMVIEQGEVVLGSVGNP
jgi:hypothetical protein